MKFLKEKKGIIIAFILGLILAGGTVYAVVSASQVIYTTDKNAEIKNVEQALNELYKIKNTTPILVGHGLNSYSSGVTTETKVIGTLDNNEILELNNNIFTTKKVDII